ncbi:MAG: glutathione synthase [Gammaproteobacteria bacterium]|nr:glutathione synthase [Gammaproteobacteria bacterium]
MTVKLGVVMDPIEDIKVHKDSTFAMLLEAQRRAWEIHYLQPSDLFLRDSAVMGHTTRITVQDDPAHWFEPGDCVTRDLSELDVILMRKDPPFDMEYIFTTFLLERVQQAGTLVVNHPFSLRNANEKLSATRFAQCIVPFVVSRNRQALEHFIDEHEETVIKPLDGMAGDSVFRIWHDDPNRNVILETATQCGARTVMAQKLIADYRKGDKRILLIGGKPVPYALVRVPVQGELRANLDKGGLPKSAALTERDKWICEQVRPELIAMQIDFAGIDVIGDFLTEINITSPTGIRELDRMCGLNIAAILFDTIEQRLGHQPRPDAP